MTVELLFYTQIASIVAFVAVLFGLYRTLVSQKDATIQLLKEKNDYLLEKLTEARIVSQDILAENLSKRVNLLVEEIERLNQDANSNERLIEEKEVKLLSVRRAIKGVEEAGQIQVALDYLSATLELLENVCGGGILRGFSLDVYDLGLLRQEWNVVDRALAGLLTVAQRVSILYPPLIVDSAGHFKSGPNWAQRLLRIKENIEEAFRAYDLGQNVSDLGVANCLNALSQDAAMLRIQVSADMMKIVQRSETFRQLTEEAPEESSR